MWFFGFISLLFPTLITSLAHPSKMHNLIGCTQSIIFGEPHLWDTSLARNRFEIWQKSSQCKGDYRSPRIMFSPKSLSKSLPLTPLKPVRLYRFPSLCLSLFTIKSTDSCKYLVANLFQRRQMWMFFLDVCACVWVSRLLMLPKSYTTIVAPPVLLSTPIPHGLRRLLPHLPRAHMPFSQAWLPAHSEEAGGFRPFVCFTFSKIFFDFCSHSCSCSLCVSCGCKIILCGQVLPNNLDEDCLLLTNVIS